MGSWIFRLVVLLACPAIVYFQITPTVQGALVGLGAGVVLIAAEFVIASVNLLTMISGVLGAAVGIFIAKLIDFALFQVIGSKPFYAVWDRYAMLYFFAFAALGSVAAVKKLPELDDLDKDILKMGKKRGADMKVVDTSAIIDGRVIDICETKFLSGTLIVPRFVLGELHHLADSPESLKRARGRRGLDVLARLQENPDIPVKILDKDVPEVPDVDGKVVRLAKDMGAKVITTDFNLNKVAALEGVVCLNVNDLGTALKPIVLPGETMSVFVMKEGKERDQGVGYLDDGTMVVVEDGRRHIGKRLEVAVTSIHQTSAGRMVFCKARGERPDKEKAPAERPA